MLQDRSAMVQKADREVNKCLNKMTFYKVYIFFNVFVFSYFSNYWNLFLISARTL